MELHEAVRHARLERKLSQKRLAELAGIQRRQLATLEKGGNVTLATVRKVLAQLPNLEGFDMDGAEVRRQPTLRSLMPSDEQIEAAIVGLREATERLAALLAPGTPTKAALDNIHRIFRGEPREQPSGEEGKGQDGDESPEK